MITFGPAQRYFLYREPCDMRKSFDGLCGLVRSAMKRDPLSGDVFVFVNRRRTHVKLLVWDRSGFVLYYKRLEEGTFELPAALDAGAITWAELMLILEGVFDDIYFSARRQLKFPVRAVSSKLSETLISKEFSDDFRQTDQAVV